MSKYVAFLDILGFKEKLKNSNRKMLNHLLDGFLQLPLNSGKT